MAWTAPMTAVAGTAFTAAQFNTHVRDNLNTTAPAVATAAGNIIVTTGLNAVTQRTPTVDFISTSQSTTSTTYTNLTTVGPTVTVTTGVRCLISVGAAILNTTAGSGGRVSIDTSGATTGAASDLNSAYAESGNASDAYQLTWTTIFDPINAGSNTFQAKYRALSGTATFSNRLMAVVPF